MSKNAVATVANTSVALPPDLDVFAEFAGAGFENVTSRDMLIPRLTILQALSPQLKKQNAKYAPGSSEGDILDTGTGELMPNPTEFLPAYFRKDYLEWAPRESGGGLKGVHSGDEILRECRVDERRNYILPNGNIVVETGQMFGLNLSAMGRPSFIAFTSTQLRKLRQWLTLANGERIDVGGRQIQPPLFYRTYLLGTAPEGNNKGTWAGWTIGRGPVLTERPDWRDLMARVTEFRASLQTGSVSADTSSLDAAAQEAPL